MSDHLLVYEKRICKDLDKIPDNEVRKIVRAFNKLAEKPFPSGAKKLSGKIGLYRIRQGDYRIVYTVNKTAKKICIILVAHRKDVYRKL